MARKPVNARQLEVLRWVADGCPDGVMVGASCKTTAVALRNRRLLKVSKRGGWHAELTDDGRYYLEHNRYPGELPKSARPKPTLSTRQRSEIRKKSSAETPSPDRDDRKTGKPSPAATIRVPAALRNPHPVVVALRDDLRRLGLTPSVRGRALRVLQALVTEAERRGWSVHEVKMRRNEYGYHWLDSKNHLIVETGEASVGVRILQQKDRSPHTPTAEELDRQQRWGSNPPKYDHTPNDYLRIEIDSRWNGRQHSWSEGVRGPIDRKLPAILDEIEYRHGEAQERRLEALKVEEEREQRRLEAVERATVLLRESSRAEVLAEQVANWRYVNQLREYVESMEKVAAGLEGDARTEAIEWIAWAHGHCERVDPLRRPLRAPDDPEPTPEALRPFLGARPPFE